MCNIIAQPRIRTDDTIITQVLCASNRFNCCSLAFNKHPKKKKGSNLKRLGTNHLHDGDIPKLKSIFSNKGVPMIMNMNIILWILRVLVEYLIISRMARYIIYNSKATNVYQYPPLYMLSMVSCHDAGESVDVHMVHRIIVGSICCVSRFLTLVRADSMDIVSLKETKPLMAAKRGICHVMTKSFMMLGSLRARNTNACPVTINKMAIPRNASRYTDLLLGEKGMSDL